MQVLLKTKIGPFLVISSVLALWTFLAAQPVQAQSAPSAPPNCPSSTIINNIAAAETATVDNTDDTLTGTLENDDDPLTTDVNERVRALYFKLTVPPLTVGELTVTEAAGSPRTVGRLCRGGSSLVVHPSAASDAANDEPDFQAENVPVTPGDYYVVVSGQNVNDAGVRQTDPEEGGISLSVSFRGVRPTAPGAPDEGSFGRDNELHTYDLTTSHPGLLTVKTTGSTDTKGELLDSSDARITAADEGGSGDNFQIVSAVPAEELTVTVQGQSATERGDYTLVVDFKIAAETISDLTSSSMQFAIEDGTKYFHFTSAVNTFLTVETKSVGTANPNTKGTLFGENGSIAQDSSSGDANNFQIQAPVSSGEYIVQVDRVSSSTGEYTLNLSSPAAADVASVDIFPPSAPADKAIAAPATNESVDVHYYSINVPTTGTLQVQTVDPSASNTPTADTTGVLYGPDGQQIARDEDSGDGTHFKITQAVEMGQYVVAVAAASRTTSGSYQLKVAFIEGADIDVGTRPGTGTGTTDERIAALEREVRELEDDLNECRAPVVTDAEGALDNPSDGSFRSGIGVISGWVCAAEEVEVEILRRGVVRETFQVAYGTSRPDVPENSSCTNENAGFGMTYNFNHLPEEEHTIRAYADGELIGSERTFTVVHLEAFAADDTDRFLRLDENTQDRGVCIVPDFPAAGERTWLRWEESTQNFVIEDAG